MNPFGPMMEPEPLTADIESTPLPDDMLPPPTPPLPPVELPPPEPTKAFRDAAFEYISKFCRASRAFVKAKQSQRELESALYQNSIGIRDWAEWSGSIRSGTSQSRKEKTQADETDVWSNYVHAPGYLVDTFADQMYVSVFSGPEWLTILTEDEGLGPQQPDQFSVAFKVQQLLLNRLNQGGIHARLYEAVQEGAIHGSVYAKVFWHEKTVPAHFLFMDSPEPVEVPDVIASCPVVQIIPCTRLLPDPQARHNDIQRWRGIGHRVEKTFDEIKNGFTAGHYNLNKGEFLSRWKDAQPGPLYGDDIDFDPDAMNEDDPEARLEIWEWHGRVPYNGKLVECVANIVTDAGVDDPRSGLLIRLTTHPVLKCGLRPFVSWHFTQRPGPFGFGLIEREQDLLYMLSQFIGQAQDNARVAANGAWLYDAGSDVAEWLKNNGKIQPGACIPKTPGLQGQLEAVPMPMFPQQLVDNLIAMLSGLLERRTAVSDLSQGISQRDKTATEASILQQQSMAPTRTKSDLFARCFIEPMARIALAMVSEMAMGDQQITIQMPGGQSVPITISPDELRNNKFRPVATITAQDHTRIAKAQSIERAIPMLANLQPILTQEGQQVSFSEMVKRYLDLIGVDGSDRVLRILTPPEQALIQENMALKQQLAGQPPPPGNGNNGGPPTGPSPLAENGGPMGDEPIDANAFAQFLQEQMRPGAQV